MGFSFVRDFLTPVWPRGRRVRRRLPTPRTRLRLEALEDRCLLSGGISLTPSEAAPQLVGEPITWTATVTDAPPGLIYQFDVGSPRGPFHVVRDFSPDNHFTWAPMQEGTYRIKVTIKDGFDAEDTRSAVVSDRVDSRVTGDEAVISPTANPLVALYSVPAGPKGMVHVEFAVAGDHPSWRSTNELPSKPDKSTNFFVAGMLPNTTYEMRDVFSDGATSSPSLFTTGSLPTTLSFPAFTVEQPPGPGSDLDQDMIFQQLAATPTNFPEPFVTDLTGHVTWYYDPSQAGFVPNRPRAEALVPGGTVLLIGGDSRAPFPTSANVLREIDLAGNPLRETNIDAVNAQLTALGHDVIYGFHHEVQRLPNGQTAVIGLTERTVNIHGTPTDYIGDMIVVLDENFQVAWAWDAFDHLDVNRGPVLGEVVQPGSGEPSSAVPRLPAVDWLHTNAVNWSPADGNLVLSIRQQDWVIKIDYQGGEGDGHIIWRLGKDGDFTVNSTDPNPWFSHQHDAHYIDDSTLILFDNGNTRQASDPTAHSRGQVWKLDEQTKTATLVFNADLGNYSFALGAAQRLSNGNYSFDSGFQGQSPKFFAQSIEVRPDGSKAYVLEVDQREYRNFRIRTLYTGISDQLAANDGGTSETDSRHRHDRDRSSGAVEPTLPDRPASDDFWAVVATSLAASPGQWAAPVTNPAATAIPASTAPLAPVSETDADPASQDVAALAAAAARDAWLADPAKDLWDRGLGDDLAQALIA
jgi:arylsulfate sulfotransferase